MIEFMTKSGILTAKKVPAPGGAGEAHGKLFIELNFPMIDFLDCNEMPSIPETLNGAPVVSVHKSAADGDLIVLSLPCFTCIITFQNKLPHFKMGMLVLL